MVARNRESGRRAGAIGSACEVMNHLVRLRLRSVACTGNYRQRYCQISYENFRSVDEWESECPRRLCHDILLAAELAQEYMPEPCLPVMKSR
jgi:hypothetical protein